MKRVITLIIIIYSLSVTAQTPHQPFPYSYDLYQKLNKETYNKNTRVHSSLKPYFLDDSLLVNAADSIFNYGIDTSRNSWIKRKLFNEHLIDIRKEEYTAYIDFLPDMIVGRATNTNTWLNTRGFQAGGTVGSKFSFYTSGYENQGKFPEYYENYVKSRAVVPGQSYDRGFGKKQRDWSYVTALLSYTPIKYLSITAGQEKTFIGDGYRSMILSDYTTNYPFLRLTAKLGNVQYMVMWAALQEHTEAPKVSYDAGNQKKGGVFHYLDWNVSNRLSLGFYDAVIWSQNDENGNRRGFDWGYANPVIFLRPLEAMSGSPDNATIGLTAKYEFLDKNIVYSQFFLDEFEAENFFAGNGSARNKFGIQAGIRGADLFKVRRLNYLLEFNTARPYTYSGRTRLISYSHYNEPLAHPFGANFKELVSMLNYSIGRFAFSGQITLADYGVDASESTNSGNNIFKPYPDPAFPNTGNYIGQGIQTDFSFINGKIAYILNPKYNLRLELGGIYRTEKNSMLAGTTKWLMFGLRSSFRNLYEDISGY